MTEQGIEKENQHPFEYEVKEFEEEDNSEEDFISAKLATPSLLLANVY